ncbi:MAG: MBL fold metallo-hydrolase [Firmicutes bacterium]|jgi:L-ascorbate metabolism protein UlaG (beta-lactamase superfamily)|nr:MBL fold metallo-hydrolase [Bacillota bacterium]
MQLKWFGHSCFLLTAGQEAWLSDPFAPSVGYPIPSLTPTVITTSHDHYDHADTSWLPQGVPVLTGESWQGEGLALRAVSSFHDQQKGAQRGENKIYIAQAEGLNFVHLGDLGHVLLPGQVEEIGKVDVLLLPVGGTYTIGPEEAWQVVAQLLPRIVIPMHYQTPHLKFELASLEEFLKGIPQGWTVEEKTSWEPEEPLAEKRIIVLKYI